LALLRLESTGLAQIQNDVVGQSPIWGVPPNPKAGFDGIVVRCQVLECEPPSRLAYSWSAGPIIDTQVSYRLEPDGGGTRVFFEHSGFDMSQPWGEQAFRGAEFGWAKMLERLPGVVGSLARRKGGLE
jgi:uncharacterized protein YndB with AHSA1/START domain